MLQSRVPRNEPKTLTVLVVPAGSGAEAVTPGTGDADRFGGSSARRRSAEEDIMRSAGSDKLKGAVHQVKGKVKELAGKVTDNPKLRAKGVAEKTAGKAQKKLGEVKKVLS
jgi:uncharacterized protein YjbJ (UPF0337 family)